MCNARPVVSGLPEVLPYISPFRMMDVITEEQEHFPFSHDGFYYDETRPFPLVPGGIGGVSSREFNDLLHLINSTASKTILWNNIIIGLLWKLKLFVEAQ